MERIALVQGASRGLGLELVRQLLEDHDRVVATCRHPERADALASLRARSAGRVSAVRLDVEDEGSIEAAAEAVAAGAEKLHLLMNVAGLLHDEASGVRPEKKLAHCDPDALAKVFRVNAFGPLLVAKHFAPLLRHDEPAVLANLSARVGSIGDDRLGGWYAYRASKAAQNMFTKNLAIELGRRAKNLCVLALHPGTVDTGLSAPFQKNVPEEKLFSVERAAGQLLAIVRRAPPAETGRFYAWDGAEIPW
ncbi:MAG TPA: SDR family NAD(P)-dependent oxidoreductase [Polyangiaceae bacterium LLY-WYZ-15_(1-7)]|nr:SDR family NAD(P)-dependent oxidoreductase [Polyangiaceae bacterium LLY-WYZ-15_(1-7)]